VDKPKLKSEIKSFIEEKLDISIRTQRLKKEFEKDKHIFYISLFDEESAFKAKVVSSVVTWIGQSFYEPCCKMIGEQVGYKVELQKKVLGECNKEIEQFFNSIENDINYKPDRENEIKKIKELTTKGRALEHPDSTVDVYITTRDNKEILIDITTVKNNKKSFRTLKTKTLRWTAMRLSQDKTIDVEAFMAIPYNPESNSIDGTDYERFSEYYDRRDLLVGDELWKKVSNNQIGINELTALVEEIGQELDL